MADVRLIDANALYQNIQDWKTRCQQLQRHSIGMYHMMIYEVLCQVLDVINDTPTIDPETLRPVAHWEEIPNSYVSSVGKNGSWFVSVTRCSNPECGEVNPCGLKTPFCPMCGFKMEDVPYDVD